MIGSESYGKLTFTLSNVLRFLLPLVCPFLVQVGDFILLLIVMSGGSILFLHDSDLSDNVPNDEVRPFFPFAFFDIFCHCVKAASLRRRNVQDHWTVAQWFRVFRGIVLELALLRF